MLGRGGGFRPPPGSTPGTYYVILEHACIHTRTQILPNTLSYFIILYHTYVCNYVHTYTCTQTYPSTL